MLVWFLVPTVLALVVGVWFFTTNPNFSNQSDSDKPLPVSKPVAGTEEFPIVGRTHLASGTPGSGYNSNPPTSGNHWAAPVKEGVYDKLLADEQLIHNLEHGYVWVSYVPCGEDGKVATISANVKCASKDVVAELKKIVEADSWKVVLAPRDKNETMIALAAWGRLLKFDDSNYDKMKDFIKTYRNRGPEKTPE